MIDRGRIDLMITNRDLDQLDFMEFLPCYRQTQAIERYYNEQNSSIWQILDESPGWVHNLATQIPQDFDHHVVSVLRVDPGQTIPCHRDHHMILQEKFGAGDTWRYLIFLEDWKNGHYFEIQNKPVIQWRAGDWIKFHRSEWHLGSNAGWEPFYSAQITVK